MISYYYSISVIVFLSLLASLVVASDAETNSAQQIIIDWVRENGGYFSNKQEFRRAIPGDATSHFGIFAKDDIQRGEVLTRVPWKCVITQEDKEEDSQQNPYFFCGSTRMLIDEMRKGEESFFAPYTAYLRSQPRGKIPSDWSDVGKDLLKQVLGGDKLPPDDVTDLGGLWQQLCYQGAPIDDLAQQALMEFHARADDNFLVPLYDLYNHAQDEKSNASVGVFTSEKQEVRATRSISRGEEIAFSYNMAQHQDSWTKNFYGTPEFLRDYGFVEPFPQRWMFDEIRFRFELTKDDNGAIKLTWLSGPDTRYFDFMREQLERLRSSVKPILEEIEKKAEAGEAAGEKSSDIPRPTELKTIRQYFDALNIAMETAIQAEHEVVETDDDDDEDDDYDYDVDDDNEL